MCSACQHILIYVCVNTQSHLCAFVDTGSLVHFTLLMLALCMIIILLIVYLDADSHVCASHSCSCVNPTENYCSCLRQSLLLLLELYIWKKSFLPSESWNGEAFATRIKLSIYITIPCRHSGFSKFSIPFPDLEKENMFMSHVHTQGLFSY